jgi:DNA helicase IV
VSVPGKAEEIGKEQEYFDRAARARAARLATLADAPSAAVHRSAAGQLLRYAKTVQQALGSASEAVAFGRMDPGAGGPLYLGRHLIRDEDGEVLVVNWHASAAAPYFEASHADPHGLRARRTFECDGNTIKDFTEVLFAQLGESIDQHLLNELARGRTGSMRDIVATIQAAQYELVRAPMDQVLIIEGGPGTGKTAVALHRVSWMLFHHRESLRPEDVLVVGPNPAFIRYIGKVLPGLGDTDVQMSDCAGLAPAVTRGRPEPTHVSRLKGEARMAGLLGRALEARIGVPEPAERLPVGDRFVTVPGSEVTEALTACRSADLPYAERRQLFRQRLAQLISNRAGNQAVPQSVLFNLVERLWPQQSAAAFLRDLLGSRRRLSAAAGGEFTAEEITSLQRRGADRVSEEVWSAADLPLLDELEHLIDGIQHRYAHVVVDEAQDLSPMQLRSAARRCPSGSLTIVGDLAQSTGPWARETWDEVTVHLPSNRPTSLVPLRYGYRVPRQVYDLAARLLPVAAPAVVPPEVVRDGPREPGIHRVALPARAGRVATLATTYAADGQFVGIVCPPRYRRETEAALARAGVEWSSADKGELSTSINLVSPPEAKGLEFDAVIVVEPEEIVADDERGHRMLYVALTRTTRYLDIVCVGEPLPLFTPQRAPKEVEQTGFTDRDGRRLAEYLAGQLRGAAPEAFWDSVLKEVRRLLDRPG